MREEIYAWTGTVCDPETMGQCTSWVHQRGAYRPICRPNLVVARIFLNLRDTSKKPNEIISHECTHAGLAWGRWKRANLRHMPGEEVVCYATGRLVRQIVTIFHNCGYFR